MSRDTSGGSNDGNRGGLLTIMGNDSLAKYEAAVASAMATTRGLLRKGQGGEAAAQAAASAVALPVPLAQMHVCDIASMLSLEADELEPCT